MKTRHAKFLVGALLAFTCAATAALYASLPATIVMHWDASGYANGTVPRNVGALLVPLLALGLAMALFVLPSIDPIDKGYANFRKEYDWLIVLIIAFLCLLQGLVLAWNLGLRFNFSRFIAPLAGLLFYFLGTVMPGFKRNWFAGIRTPWTLSSDEIWRKTHEKAGSIFHIAGLIACLGAVFPRQALYLVFIPILSGTGWVVAYSYLAYRKNAAS